MADSTPDRWPIAVAFASVGLLVASLVGGSVGELVFGILVMAFAPLLMLVGTAGRRAFVLPIVTLLAVLELCLAGIWIYRGQIGEGPWWLGLPATTAILLYGLVLVPLLVLSLGFALTFRHFDVGPGDLRELRSRAPSVED